jgi:hypothetical protein
MSEKAYEEKSIRVLTFSGKKIDFPVWSEKFLAKARRRGYKNILEGADTIPKESTVLVVTTDEGKKDSAIRDANILAYEELILSVDGTKKTGRVAFQIIKGCKTTANPSGNATMAWKRLNDKYLAKTAPSLLKLKREFTKSKLSKKENDPDEWITDLEEKRI